MRPTWLPWTRLRAPRSLMDTIGADAIKTAAQAGPLQDQVRHDRRPGIGLRMLASRLAPLEPEPVDLPPILPTGIDLPPMPRQVRKAEPSTLDK